MLKLAILLSYSMLNAQAMTLRQNIEKLWPSALSSIKSIENSQIIVDADVSSNKKTQSFKLEVMALHKKSCKVALRKIKRFEQYNEWISFIKTSTYNEKRSLLTIRADHTLLPTPMIVHIVTKRPTKPGVYPFMFPTGIFTGLTGKYHAIDIGNKCLFYAKSYWSGKETKYPNFIIELFAHTLTKKAGEIVMRKTSM